MGNHRLFRLQHLNAYALVSLVIEVLLIDMADCVVLPEIKF